MEIGNAKETILNLNMKHKGLSKGQNAKLKRLISLMTPQ